MTYKTSLDKTAMVITTSVTILFAIIIYGQYAFIKNEGNVDPIYTTTACLLIYLFAFAFRPISYSVTNEDIVVNRLLFNVRIKKAEIRRVELVAKERVRRSIRTFGVGGLFGYYGKFANFDLGRMTWYATRRDRTVLITTTDDRKIIITPNDPEKFVAEYNI